MINLVLSSSQQAENSCASGDTEQNHTQLITNAVYSFLNSDPNLNVYNIPRLNLGTDTENLIKAVRLSNSFINENGGTGYHLSIHTDAGYSGTGASGFYFSDKGAAFGKPIFDEISALTPWKDMQFKRRQSLYELKNTTAVSFLLEVSFHDKKEESDWIHQNINNIAISIIKGIYKGLDIQPYPVLDVVDKMKQSGYLNDSNYWIIHFRNNEPIDPVFCYNVFKNVTAKSYKNQEYGEKTKQGEQ